MYLSKIWFFFVAVGGAIALTLALLMPRPAEREAIKEERRKLVVGCGVVNILLEDDARKRIELAGLFGREPTIEGELAAASAAATLDEARMKKARGVAETVMKGIEGSRKPDFAWLIDKRGRVVARALLDEADFGDVAAGRPLVDDALAGYLRDDLWMVGTTLYVVSASPVISNTDYVGAVVLGHRVTNDFATRLVGKSLLVHLGFYRSDGQTVAATEKLAIEQTAASAALGLLKSPDLHDDCANDNNKPVELTAGNNRYSALVARLPGEAGARGAYYAVFAEQPAAKGFSAALDGLQRSDLSFSAFPWLLVAGAFLAVLAIGIALMWLEADRPLRRLAGETVKLAKGERERLGEDAHPGKFGSIARSVNIHIDKLGREAKSAKQDLDQLLGPAPEGSLGTIDLLASALPAVRPGGAPPAAPPPPSDFKFTDTKPPPRPPVQTPPAPSARVAPPQMSPVGRPARPPLSLDDDILANEAPTVVANGDTYYRQIYDQFIETKQSCNEPTSGLTFEKFRDKLTKNRDDLMAKTGCREVRFTVYVKEGKAALKATPVKDE